MPEHCGPRSPLPPEKQNRSMPICAYVFRFSIGGMPAASSSISGTPAFFVTASAAFSRSPSQVVYTIAVRSVRAPARSSTLPTTTSFAPANRIALSNALRPPSMTTSFFMPVVSGSCQTLFGSVPAMQPAVAAAIAPAAPEVTMPDSAPDSSRQLSSGGLLQFEDVDEVLRRVLHGAADLGQFERTAQVGPRPARVDEGPHAEPAIDVPLVGGAGCGGQ